MPAEAVVGLSTTSEGQINMVLAPKMRAVIADDEPLSREKLRMLLERESEVQIVAECTGLEDTLNAVRTQHPDVLLLDIEMEGGTGFEVLRDLPNGEKPIVIFTTAYDSYALQAFEAQALDYLLKPFDQERLHRALERARSEVAKAAKGALNENLADLISAARRPKAENRLIIKSGGRVVFIQIDEIDWIEAAANYVRLHVAGKNAYLFRESIGRMADKLDPTQFIRIHRSFIVNVSKIKELQPCNNGEFMVSLRNGKELPCSRFYRHALESLWKGTR
ncbi:MAG TPA: LytTR family DNA-binding domain-containing protein [Terriglobales bacterium]|nr:LytTR family DNA-binding domain-containing protein [Terriglobales bacterium]